MTCRTRERSALLLATLAVVAAAVVFPGPASALDRGSMGTIGPTKTHLEFTGTPIAGIYPTSGAPAQPFAAFRPPACQTATYCDFIQFEVDYPANYLREVFFGLTITLTWDNPRSKDNPTGNDVDLFLWGNLDPTSGGPASKCGSPTDDVCDNIHPEVISVTEPPNTTAEDADPAGIFLTVVNESGVNTGYKLTADWYTFDLPPPPRFTPPERETTSFKETVQGPFDFEVTESKGPATPEPTPRKILVPGPDGKLYEVELPIYAAGQRLGSTAERNSAVPWIVAGIAGALALAVLILYLRRRTQTMEP